MQDVILQSYLFYLFIFRPLLSVNKLTNAFYGPSSPFKHTLSAGEGSSRSGTTLPKRSDTFGGFDNGKEPAHPRGKLAVKRDNLYD